MILIPDLAKVDIITYAEVVQSACRMGYDDAKKAADQGAKFTPRNGVDVLTALGVGNWRHAHQSDVRKAYRAGITHWEIQQL